MVRIPKDLKGLDIINLIPGEHVIVLQRQHWIVLLFPFVVNILIVCIIAAGFFWFGINQSFVTVPMFVVTTMALFILSLLAFVGTYSFMNWYYSFYFVTNKRFMHARFFRLGGSHAEEVLYNTRPFREIDSKASNIIYDILDIEDVYIHFHGYETSVPFVFRAPSNAAALEQTLERLCLDKDKL